LVFDHVGVKFSPTCLVEPILIAFAVSHFGCNHLYCLRRPFGFDAILENDEKRIVQVLSNHMAAIYVVSKNGRSKCLISTELARATNLLVGNPRNGPRTVNIVGIANFDSNPDNLAVVVKIEAGTSFDHSIVFNRAIGVNRANDVDEADNEVIIIETGGNEEASYNAEIKEAQSYLKAHSIQG